MSADCSAGEPVANAWDEHVEVALSVAEGVAPSTLDGWGAGRAPGAPPSRTDAGDPPRRPAARPRRRSAVSMASARSAIASARAARSA